MPARAGDPDVVIIGSGPNGLVAGCQLARAGFRVLVLEANPTRFGGAVGSESATRPGFLHDVGAAFFPWRSLSPAFRELALEHDGLIWKHAPIQSCHPAPDGTCASIVRSIDRSMMPRFGSLEDGRAWNELADWYARIEPYLLPLLLHTIPHVSPIRHLSPRDAARLASVFLSTGAGLSRRWFRTEAARRVLPGLALHVDVGPEDRFGGALGFLLGMTATTSGYAVPQGGAQALADALTRALRARGGDLRLGARVVEVIVREGKACAVRLQDGEELVARRAVVADTDVATLFTRLVRAAHVPSGILHRMRTFSRGWGTFKIDWALDGTVPWTAPEARAAAVVHVGDSIDDLVQFTRDVRSGQLPDHPYLVVGQQSLADPTRAPAGQHTLWAYSRVPATLAEGWPAHAQAFADTVERRIEALAPGFRQAVLARRVVSPPDLEAMNENLVGGDLGGGSSAWRNQLILRPLFPYFRYRMPIARLYLCSSSAHPGAGVHGMCGFNAAAVVLRDVQ